MDAFYNVLTDEQHQLATQNEYNFDRPEAFDFELLIDTLKRLKARMYILCMYCIIYQWKSKDERMGISLKRGIRYPNLLRLLMTLYVPLKTAKTYNGET